MWFPMTGAELPQPVQRSIFTCARSRPSKESTSCALGRKLHRFDQGDPSA
jgi:hypothetical protein